MYAYQLKFNSSSKFERMYNSMLRGRPWYVISVICHITYHIHNSYVFLWFVICIYILMFWDFLYFKILYELWKEIGKEFSNYISVFSLDLCFLGFYLILFWTEVYHEKTNKNMYLQVAIASGYVWLLTILIAKQFIV